MSRILNGERVFGSGGGAYCDGVVARAVERQRMHVFCWRDCRSNLFQQLDGRSVGAVVAMGGKENSNVKRYRSPIASKGALKVWSLK